MEIEVFRVIFEWLMMAICLYCAVGVITFIACLINDWKGYVESGLWMSVQLTLYCVLLWPDAWLIIYEEGRAENG